MKKKNYRVINIFVSHPFNPKNTAYDILSFRTAIRELIAEAEKIVRKEYSDFEITITFDFNDGFVGLPEIIEKKIRECNLGIVDITENKANIFFEYGLMFGLNIPVLLIKAKSSMSKFPIPGDITNRLVNVYQDLDELVKIYSKELASSFKKLLNSHSLFNIYLPKIWFPEEVSSVNIITSSEFDKREQFALPESDNYMMLESLGDKDTLLHTVAYINRNYRKMNIDMYASDKYGGSLEGNMIIIGGPGDEDGDANNICKILMDKMKLKISYSEDCECLLYDGKEYRAVKNKNKTTLDYGYFARFPNPYNPESTVILLHGIHTFGVLGASKAFSDHPSAQDNLHTLSQIIKLDDIKQVAFECFFPVEVLHQTVVVPIISEDCIVPID